ncbi:hypothetical protein [Streptomyces sp. SID11385]|uniref:hypothetical protein n=1 Tax=Streptomyces sp. SID11385 TaxID=2706031 RepID=UPI0013CB6442|nr:hypothetical protein [Streptomyces sp. SID11385]NEA42852.1 hypothetical protein [Streptomyces sp. SID11385]
MTVVELYGGPLDGKRHEVEGVPGVELRFAAVPKWDGAREDESVTIVYRREEGVYRYVESVPGV